MKVFFYTIISLVFFINLTFSQQWWFEQTSNTTNNLQSVSVYNNQTAWICGVSGTVLRTTNTGNNWINANSGSIPANADLVNIWAIDGATALVAGDLGSSTGVWKTTDGGTNWIQVFAQTGGFIDAIAMKDGFPYEGIMIGDPVGGRWSVWKTINAGTNWDSAGLYIPQNGIEAGWNNSICYTGSSIWFGTNNSRIYYSSNDGISWLSRSTAPEQNSYSIFFSNAWNPSGLLGGASLMLSNDSGATWTPLNSMGTGNFGGITGLPVPVSDLFIEQIWYVRTSANIYKSGGGGSGWFSEYQAQTGAYLHISKARNGTYIWAVRSQGGITLCTCFVSGISKISGKVPDKYFLKQNFPNPFNPQTNIDFDLPKKSRVKINVYDETGRIVTNLIDNDYTSGSYRVTWDASGYSSGVYFYTIIADEFVQTKKMVLIK